MTACGNTGNFGIGVGIEETSRFECNDCLKGGRFIENTFTKNEQDYCFSKKHTHQHLAARYAAKMAVYKALSELGRADGISYLDVEIENDDGGCPKARFMNEKLLGLEAKISLSHSAGKAIAFAMVEIISSPEAL